MSRPLEQAEIDQIIEALESSATKYSTRNLALFVLGLKTGFRISELLSIKVEDIWRGGKVTDYVVVERRYMKKKVASRQIPLTPTAKQIIERYLTEANRVEGPLFLSQKTKEGEPRSIRPDTAWHILQKVYDELGLSGKLGIHCLRKTFATKVYENTGQNLLDTQAALGHKSVQSTVHYLKANENKVKAAVLALD